MKRTKKNDGQSNGLSTAASPKTGSGDRGQEARMRRGVHGLDERDLRFQEDARLRTDRVPAPFVRIPFAESMRLRWQKRGNDRPLLSFQSLRCAGIREGIGQKGARATKPFSRHTESESPNTRPWSTTAKMATTPSSTPRPQKRGPHKRRNPRNGGRRQPFGRDKRPPRQNGEVHAGPFRLRSSAPSGLDESVLAVDERVEGQNG